MAYSQWSEEVLEGKSLLALADVFRSSGHDTSYVSEQIFPDGLDLPVIENRSRSQMPLNIGCDVLRKYTDEWMTFPKTDFYISMPCLLVSTDDFEASPAISVSFTTIRGHDPSDHVGGLPITNGDNEDVALQAKLRKLLAFENSEPSDSYYILCHVSAIEHTMTQLANYFEEFESDQRTLFLSRLAFGLTQCAGRYAPITRGISHETTDTRLGALVEMTSRVLEALCDRVTSRSGISSDAALARNLIEIARYSSCEFELARACGFPLWAYHHAATRTEMP